MKFSKPIPTNLITGFLGVGKTTAIKHLLKHKPEQENWAILVNEFGEIGVDGSLLESSGAAIKQVPGGCMCCVQGVGMRVGLNELIKLEPDRILIEPTGLGHPRQIMDTLTGEYFAKYLEVRATITMLDPETLLDERYTENENFIAQAEIADMLVANKIEQASEQAIDAFLAWSTQYPNATQLAQISFGQIAPEWLDRPAEAKVNNVALSAQHTPEDNPEIQALELPEQQNWVMRSHFSDDFWSYGWLISDKVEFEFNDLLDWITSIKADRVKAVIKTNKGVLQINAVGRDVRFEPSQLNGHAKLELVVRRPIDIPDLELMLA
ncbi:CobW family GTP-binding protein [Gayadomonas joobiniege]|uniref:CobW family GTP-binding protein n=1 Tax=Gayadomonas joobiniege TaxID=1234606 RepID=UPI000361C92B|nr:GTP-binding protein [Gayadomonas joobiniege]